MAKNRLTLCHATRISIKKQIKKYLNKTKINTTSLWMLF